MYYYELSKFFKKLVIDNKFAKICDDDDGLFLYLETQSSKSSIVSWKDVHDCLSRQQLFESATDFLQHQIDIHDASKQLYITNRTMLTFNQRRFLGPNCIRNNSFAEGSEREARRYTPFSKKLLTIRNRKKHINQQYANTLPLNIGRMHSCHNVITLGIQS
jgi:hypothetical protein